MTCGYGQPMTDAPDDETLDELQDTIDAARRQAEEDGLIEDPDKHEQTFADPDGDGVADQSPDAP
jgi:hypothetical protein